MTQRIRPGDQTLNADHLNRQSDMALDYLGSRGASGNSRLGLHQKSASHYQNHDPDIVWIRNDTGCELNKFDPAGLDRLQTLDDQPVFSAGKPNGCRHAGQIAIVLDKIAVNSIGRAVISGYTVSLVPENAKGGVDLPDGNPDFVAGSADLNSVTGGSIEALWSVPKYNTQGAWIGGVRVRNAAFGLVTGEDDACGCSSSGCEYECQEDSGSYAWSIINRSCSSGTTHVSGGTVSEFCDCPDVSYISPVRRPCDQTTVGHRVTMSCVESGTTPTEITVDVPSSVDCDSTCRWKRPAGTDDWVMVEGCQSDCDQNCRCVHPSLADINTANNVIMPCVAVSNDGLCIHKSLGSSWQKVFDGCDRGCPCDEPAEPASFYPLSQVVARKCSEARCAPCYPEGYCRWKHSIVSSVSGLFTIQRSSWQFMSSECGPYCECRQEPPYSTTGTFSSYLAPYADGEIVDVPCCRSPLGVCDPTSTTTTQSPTTQPPTTTNSTPPPGTTTTSTTSTTTTSAPTTGCPTVNPRTTLRPKTFQDLPGPPTCLHFCYRQCPSYQQVASSTGAGISCLVFQEQYTTISLGWPVNGLGTPICDDTPGNFRYCELSQPCNATTAGTVIPGICKQVLEYVPPDTVNYIPYSGTPQNCKY